MPKAPMHPSEIKLVGINCNTNNTNMFAAAMLRIILFVFITTTLIFSDRILAIPIAEELQQIGKSAEKENLVELLVTYKSYKNAEPTKLFRLGRDNDGGYVVPELALKSADVLLGYGIADDISFEEQFAHTYKKPSFGFDCGAKNVKSNSPLFTFVDECIGSENFLYPTQSSSNKISNFTSHFNKLGLENKKIFLKMDIEGAEYMAFEDILKYSKNITGIAIEIHISNMDTLKKAISLLSSIEEDFVLLHVHGNNNSNYYYSSKNSKGSVPNVLELSYINKSLIDSYHFLETQTHPTNLDMPNNPYKDDIAFEIINKY